MDGMNEFNNTGATGSTPGPGTPESTYTGYTTAPGTGPQNPYGGPYTGPIYPPPPPPPPGTPNPGLAALLGFIRGVGAMYNGQFAKGIAHIVIFAVLTSLANHANEIFGLFVAGWIFYMIFDAYQTARARRDGLQVPDPFGLNNIGERFGLGHGPNWNDFVARPAAGTQASVPGAEVPPYAPAPDASAYPPPPAGSPYSAGAAYRQPEGYAAPAYANTYVPPAPGAVPPPYPPYGGFGYGVPPVPPFDPAAMPRSGVPSGAVWLIGLGVLALLSSLGHNYYFHGRFFAGWLLVGIGVILLVQQLRRARTVYPTRSAAANWYAVNSSRGGVSLIAVGIFMLLDASGIAHWHYTWPYLLILLGLYRLASRTAYNRMIAETPSPYGAPVEQSGTIYTPPPPTENPTSIVPRINEEGR